MSEYQLYYWPVPFRGQFVRAVLAYAGVTWTEGGHEAIEALMSGPVEDMPVPFMGPPVLVDRKAEVAIAQMPAIILYLGETLDLLPSSASLRALSAKVVNDANDVIDELTLDGGREMWTSGSWRAFVPRLRKWMSIWEETGRRHGLQPAAGFLLGGNVPGLADVITHTLWSTMTDRLPTLGPMLQSAAPMTTALVRRMGELPALAALAASTRQDFGETYCGGQIGASIRKVLTG
ncbi:glutathione S-transferase [Caulobacter sp. S45]|uniref:glutathione S-transferase n=1 Tax=Caulobacter sp. S45 TaxID=1641861 RepID=UPI0015760904|nr:glutathione S-transferase [Caulobacter sp. S45]